MPRFFVTPARGEEREKMLAGFRAGMRGLLDPTTGAPFTEAKIARATREGGRWFAEFDAVDLAVLALHAKAGGLADQMIPSRSTTGTLRALHAPLRGVVPLPATGGTNVCEAVATVGSLFVGSTTLPDSAAAFATDPGGKKYQLLYNVTTPANGLAGSDAANPLVLIGVDTGEATNLAAGTKMRWAGNFPLGAATEFVTVEDGSGGIEDETDAELADRIESDIRHRPESGNNAHVRAWGRSATTAVEDIFAYAGAKYAGSIVIVPTQKRGRQREAAPKGPTARIPSAGTLARVRAYLVPPASPVVPERIVSYVVAPVGERVNMSIGLAIPRGRGLGWEAVLPWPRYSGGPAVISALTSQTVFKIASPVALPSSSSVPPIMAWSRDISRWERLRVMSIASGGVNVWDVVLSAAPSITLAVGDYISPAIRERAVSPLALGVERYFDSLGPGEVVNLSTDLRAPRAQRFVDPLERFPQRAGSPIINALQLALPGAISTGEVLEQSATTPTVPSDPVSGPSLLVAGRVAVYPSD